MKKETLVEKLARYFEKYKKTEILYVSSDGYVFINPTLAKQHQDQKNEELKKKEKALGKIKSYERAEVVKDEDVLQGGDPASYPEGEVAKEWKVSELRAFLTEKEVPFVKSEKHADLLTKAKEVTSKPTE